jgi:NAD(P)-dependent dehydrogenase (short-subunit alcohol dehydrogenase family)
MSEKLLSESGVVILGGTAGVGLETAAHFARAGSRIALMGRKTERGDAACATVRERVPGSVIHFVRVDAVHPQDALRAEREARARLGAIDVLICTTGPSHPPQLLKEIPIADIQARLNEIVLPPLHMMHACLPAMRAQKSGAIVNVASDAAKVATPGETLIGAAMASIVMFSKAAALEEKRHGIRINLLTPSLIAGTPGAALIFADPFSAKMFEKASAMAHLGVAEATEDLAAMALFLASPAARRVTGQAISVNGGISVA